MAAMSSLSYARSSRLSFHLSSFAAGGQHKLNRSSNDTGYVMPHSIGFTGGMGMNYRLSPRTQVGIDVEARRLMNRYQKAYVTNANASIGRKMGMHWFLRVYGGGSYTRSTTQQFYRAETDGHHWRRIYRLPDLPAYATRFVRPVEHGCLWPYGRHYDKLNRRLELAPAGQQLECVHELWAGAGPEYGIRKPVGVASRRRG